MIDLIVFTILLGIFALIDLKYKAVPSVLLTGSLILLTFIRFSHFKYVLILTLFGLLLWEFAHENEVAFGIADIKILAMIGFFIGNIGSMVTFLLVFSISQVLYLFVMRKYTKFEEIPFIPMLFAIWIGGLLGGLWI